MMGSMLAAVAILAHNRKSGSLYGLKIPLIIVGGLMTLIVLLTSLPIILFSKYPINISAEVATFILWFAPSIALVITGIILKRKTDS